MFSLISVIGWVFKHQSKKSVASTGPRKLKTRWLEVYTQCQMWKYQSSGLYWVCAWRLGTGWLSAVTNPLLDSSLCFSLSDPQPLRRQRYLQPQEESGDRRRSNALSHCFPSGCCSHCWSVPLLPFFIVIITVAFSSECARFLPRHWRSHHVGLRLRRGAHLAVP